MSPSTILASATNLLQGPEYPDYYDQPTLAETLPPERVSHDQVWLLNP